MYCAPSLAGFIEVQRFEAQIKCGIETGIERVLGEHILAMLDDA